ncbi:MAG: hypothetical protein JXQ85_07150 [Cognatishimia sp.]|uniref:DUF6497 family protein n=1 Tax=Cognatishimia sp. TaxID=2211648 RepID=UPI003B8D2D0F
MFDHLNVALKIVAIGGALQCATTAGAMEDSPVVPSGLQMTLQETLYDQLQDGTKALRLRFVAPAIGADDVTYSTVSDDFAVICQDVGLPKLATDSRSVDQIIVSFSDRETAFGVANSDVTQYFEVFTLENDTCIWEAF